MKKFALFLTSLILTLVAIELFLKHYQPFGVRLKGEKIVLSTHATVVYETRPTHKLDSQVVVQKNSLGFRGEEPPTYFPSYISLVTIGGSTTESIMITEGKTWTDLLGEKLRNNFEKVWVNNAGLDGHSTFGHLILLTDYVAALQPKYALFLIGANDLALYEGRESDVLEVKKQSENGPFEMLLEKSEIVSLLTNIQRKRAAEALGLSHNIINFSALAVKSGEQYPDYKALQEASASTSLAEIVGNQKEYEQYLIAFRQRLETLVDESRKNNIAPILVTQPAAYGPATDEATGADLGRIVIYGSNGEWGEGMTGLEKWRFLESYNEVTRQIAQEKNVPLVDLARKLSKNTEYFYDYIHFSNAGSEKVAQILYQEVCPLLWEAEKTHQHTPCLSE